MNRLKSLLAGNRTTLLVFICIMGVYGLSYYKRQATYAHWLENRDDYVVEHVTAMSTMDAYFWLKMARDLDAGKTGKELDDPLKAYPDLDIYPEAPNLLAELISFCTRFTDSDYYQAGLILVPILAGLFVFPLFLYFNTLGFGASAVLGGLIGSFSVAYYSRSVFGYVDTDMLNTFFPLTVSALIVLIDRERSRRGNLLLAAGAGTAMYLFSWWYQQPAFFLIYLPFIAAYLFLQRLPWKQAGWLLLAFTLASGPQYVLQSAASVHTFISAYFLPKVSGQIAWPDVLADILEARQSDLMTKLTRLHGLLPVVFAGLAGLVWLCITRWKKMMPILPLVLLGLWSLAGPRRFTMYLAPFIGIGVGVWIELLVRQAGQRLKLRPAAGSVTAMALMAVLFFTTAGYTGYHVIPGPIVPAATIKAFLDIKRVVPPHSAMLAWWDNGYPLMEIGEFATYHDGALHGRDRSTLVGKALTSSRQEELVSMLAWLEEYGFNALNNMIVEKNLTGDQMLQTVFGYPPQFRGRNVYVLYTEDMIDKFASISRFGTWDFSRQASDPMTYRSLTCFSRSDNILNCRGGNVDLTQGVMTGSGMSVPLKAALFVNDGTVVERFDYPAGGGYYLQVLMQKGRVFKVQVVEERLFRTNFNQQYLLGNYDRNHFEEVYNNFPVARVLKVRSAGNP